MEQLNGRLAITYLLRNCMKPIRKVGVSDRRARPGDEKGTVSGLHPSRDLGRRSAPNSAFLSSLNLISCSKCSNLPHE